MSTIGGNNSVRDGLVFYYDTGNVKSFRGEPTTNVVTNTDLDNGWAKHYCAGIKWNDVPPPRGVSSQVVSFYDADDTSGYWYCYGDYTPQVPGETYTISIYVKTNDSNFNIYAYTADNSEVGRVSTNTINVPNDGDWHRVVFNPILNPSNSQSDSLSFKFTYGNPSGESQRTWLCAPQMEPKTYATPFTSTQRTVTESLYDLKGKSFMDVTNTSFDSDGMFFDGVNNKLAVPTFPSLDGLTEATIEFIIQRESATSNGHVVWASPGLLVEYLTGDLMRVRWYQNVINSWGVEGRMGNLPYHPSEHVTITYNSGTVQMFHQGELITTLTNEGNTLIGTPNNVTFMYRDGVDAVDGRLPITKLYNKALTPQQVKQNYNSYRSRFNLP